MRIAARQLVRRLDASLDKCVLATIEAVDYGADQPMEGIRDDAKAFVRTWGDVGDLLDAATHKERLLILRHDIEVIELRATDTKEICTWARRLFLEVRSARSHR